MNQLQNTNSPVILIADDDRDILSIIEAILQEMTDTHLNVYEQEDDEVPFDISDIIADRKVRKDNS